MAARVAVARHFADDVGRHPHRRTHAHRAGKRGEQPPAKRRHRGDRPFGGQHPCPPYDLVVAFTFRAQKPQDGRHGREADAAVVKRLRVEPVLVEVETARQRLLNRLMEARRDQTTHPCLCHDLAMRAHPVGAAILAGGQARRFGGRQSRLVVGGQPIIVRQVEVLQRITPDVCIVAAEAARFADLSLPVHADVIPGAGAMGGVYTALEVATSDRVLVVACDLPFLDELMLGRLVELAAAADGAWVRTPGGVEPLLACYRREARTTIRAQILGGRLSWRSLAACSGWRSSVPASWSALGQRPASWPTSTRRTTTRGYNSCAPVRRARFSPP